MRGLTEGGGGGATLTSRLAAVLWNVVLNVCTNLRVAYDTLSGTLSANVARCFP